GAQSLTEAVGLIFCEISLKANAAKHMQLSNKESRGARPRFLLQGLNRTLGRPLTQGAALVRQ
ncbi:hypothetical protein, partial [Stenotrophomonas sp. YIM B06876]|uniref:hypothetical protein n=1 Tax=Stenotrophomonas sp. YIM B06876 TaxID=3060211 RepID=UPI002739638D